MHLYKNFFKLLKNNKIGLIIYGVIFFVMIISLMLSASSMAGGEVTYSKSFAITYEVLEDTPFSEGFIEYISRDNSVTDLTDATAGSKEDQIFFGMSDIHFVIGDDTISYMTSFHENGNTYMLTHLAENYKSIYDSYILMGKSAEEASSYANEVLSEQTTINVMAQEETENGRDVSVFYINQFYGYLAIGIMCLGVGHTVIANNDPLVSDRIESSPTTRKKISFTNTMGLISSGVVLWVIFLLINLIMGYGTKILEDHFILLAVNSFLVTLVACSIASLLTSFSISSNSLAMVTNITTLGMSFISGVFVSQWYLGEGLLKVARFLPLYWNVYANNMTSIISHTDYDLNKLLMCFGIELLFACAFSVIAALVKTSKVSKIAE